MSEASHHDRGLATLTTRAEEQARRRARLVDAARQLADDGGYEAVQMRTVAQHAGVALGTLYRYFTGKDHLLLAVLFEVMEEVQREIEDRPPVGDTPADRISDLVARACVQIERHPRLFRATVMALATEDEACREMRAATGRQFRTHIRLVLQRDSVDDFEAVAHVLGLVWFATLHDWVVGHTPPGTMAADVAQAARLILR